MVSAILKIVKRLGKRDIFEECGYTMAVLSTDYPGRLFEPACEKGVPRATPTVILEGRYMCFTELAVFAQLGGEALGASGFRTSLTKQSERVYLPIGFSFRQKESCWIWVDWATGGGVSFPTFCFPRMEGKVDLNFLKLRVSIQGNYDKPCGKFHQFSLAISYKFLDFNFAPCVLYFRPIWTQHCHQCWEPGLPVSWAEKSSRFKSVSGRTKIRRDNRGCCNSRNITKSGDILSAQSVYWQTHCVSQGVGMLSGNVKFIDWSIWPLWCFITKGEIPKTQQEAKDDKSIFYLLQNRETCNKFSAQYGALKRLKLTINLFLLLKLEGEFIRSFFQTCDLWGDKSCNEDIQWGSWPQTVLLENKIQLNYRCGRNRFTAQFRQFPQCILKIYIFTLIVIVL